MNKNARQKREMKTCAENSGLIEKCPELEKSDFVVAQQIFVRGFLSNLFL